jgi:alpha-glucuronidase
MPSPMSSNKPKRIVALASSLLVFAALSPAGAQTADQAWLRPSTLVQRPAISLEPRALGFGIMEQAALRELKDGNARLLGGAGDSGESPQKIATILGTVDEVRQALPNIPVPSDLQPEGYWIYWNGAAGNPSLVVAGADHPGLIYGVFALFRLIATGQEITRLEVRSEPVFHIRWVDQWDNPDGTIERGYAGRSIFFEGGEVRQDLAPVSEYARLLASVGINGCNLNNVNANPDLLKHPHLEQIARIADAMRPYGVHVALSVAVNSPQTVGGLATSDPRDATVKAWWTAKAKEIFELIPDFAGFTVKADSEGQPGPSSYGRTAAEAANVLASALAPHGVVLYRSFVYDHHLDWTNPKADRARAAYDIFHPLDGQFAANVIIQTKLGPIDFQAREPVSPLFAGLQKTSQAMEVQITQEYTGQQRHLVYLAPMWKEALDFDFHVPYADPSTLETILSGGTFRQPTGGMVGVANVGRDAWLGSPLALANLYAMGRLAWDPGLDPEAIAEEWTRQTISNDAEVIHTVDTMLMDSWPAYESYTGPLGLQTLTDITGSHYGPNVESSERNGWGQWHDADAQGVGMDRSVAYGTKFAGQYPPQVAGIYESTITTPDELMLFFHHLPYNRALNNGKSVIQQIYDSHYEGAAKAAEFVQDWSSLKDRIDPKLYADVLARLEYQAGHAIVWRDAVVQYFHKLSGLPDEEGRAGNYPGRLEAESARLTGYKVIDIHPWEDASQGKAVTCGTTTSEGVEQPAPGQALYQGTTSVVPNTTQKDDGALAPAEPSPCAAEWTFDGKPGNYNIAVQYFDLRDGVAKFTFRVNGQSIAAWSADASLPSRIPNGDNSTRRNLVSVALKPGDILRVEGTPDGKDPAALDYIEITPVAPPPAASEPPAASQGNP